jgi:glycosyltransferase involved in cell wall biosynthesis
VWEKHSADFCVVTSRYEGSNITILEALACRTMVISFDVGGATDYIIDGKKGYLVPPEMLKLL